jgi:hypothetical protein
MVVLMPENGPPDDEALSAERRIPFLEPASLWPWIPLPAGGPFQSSSAPGGDAEPSARWGRLQHMGRSAGQTEMDALGDLRGGAFSGRFVACRNITCGPLLSACTWVWRRERLTIQRCRQNQMKSAIVATHMIAAAMARMTVKLTRLSVGQTR